MTSPYDFWQRALAGEEVGGPTLPVHDGVAHPGFWRKRTSKAGPFVPVAIWEGDEALIALVDGKIGDAAEVWSYVCRHPVTEESYRSRVETGKWSDEDGAVAASLTLPPASQAIGANNPPDEAEIIKAQIEAASANIADYAEIKDDETAAKAQGVRSRLLELSGEADKKRETEKKPHLEAGKAVDERWQPIVKLGKSLADTIRGALSAYETRKAKKLAEEVAAREEARIKQEREAVKLAAKGKPAPPPLPPEPIPEPVQTKVVPSYGRAASIKVVKRATVIDQDKAYAAMRTHKELIELIAKLAQRAADAGIPIAGVEITEERTVT